MRILIACEYSGIVRDAFIAQGHDAMSCDLLPTDAPGPHYQGDISIVLDQNWDMLIAHPPCTYLCNSGVSHLHKDASRWLKLFEGADFFKMLLDSPIPKICVENPVMHKYARRLIGCGQTQIVQPWMFGHTESKATGLWLKGLPKLEETNNVKAEMMLLPDRERQRLHYLPPSPDRWKLRSTTYAGIGDAMAKQWGSQ
tara:strand:+ start:35068 stop:35661 length:594 start_codon:yes stop_codon:yes gene_type:complete